MSRFRDVFEAGTEAHQALRQQAKNELRKRFLAVRQAIPKEQRAQHAERVAAQLKSLAAWKDATTIAGYAAFRGELDPAPALRIAHAEGKRIALPRDQQQPNEAPQFAEQTDSLVRSPKGFMVPPECAADIDIQHIDLILVPLLAIDGRGFRLGYGSGWYDRALPLTLRAASVGLAFDFQLVPELPNTAHDVALDWIVTPSGIQRCHGGADSHRRR